MTRFQALARRPKRTLAVLASVLVAIGVAVGSAADFTAQSANPSNTFTSGTLTMLNSKDAAAIFSPTNMKPGATPDLGTVDIKNTGSLSGVFSLSRTNLTNSDGTNPMSDKINLIVTDCGLTSAPDCGSGTVKYNGTLTAMNSSVPLSTFAPDEERRYQFSAQLDSSAGNVYQGDNTSARFQWDATQTP